LEHLQSLPFISFMLLVEAAIAWRHGRHELALTYCSKSQSVAHLRPAPAWLADAIVAVIRKQPDESLVERAMSPEASVVLRAQMCAAQALAGGTLAGAVRRRVHSELAASQYPPDARLEWLTPREIQRAMEDGCPATTS
jgi:hypothetical protein